MSGGCDNLLCRGRVFSALRANVRVGTFIGRIHRSNGISLVLRGPNFRGVSSFSGALLGCVERGSKEVELGSGDPTRSVCTAFNIDGGAFGGKINSLCGGRLVALRRSNVALTSSWSR